MVFDATSEGLSACIRSKVEELLKPSKELLKPSMSNKDLNQLKKIGHNVAQKIGLNLRKDGEINGRFTASIQYRVALGFVTWNDRYKGPKSLPVTPLREDEQRLTAALFNLDREFVREKGYEGLCDPKFCYDDGKLITTILEPLTRWFISLPAERKTHFDRNCLLQRVKLSCLILMNRILYDAQTGHYDNNLAEWLTEQSGYKKWLNQLQVTIAFATYTVSLCYYYYKTFKSDALEDCIAVPIELLLTEQRNVMKRMFAILQKAKEAIFWIFHITTVCHNFCCFHESHDHGDLGDEKIAGKIFITAPHDFTKYTSSKLKELLGRQLETNEVNIVQEVVQKVRLGLKKDGQIDRRFTQSINYRLTLEIIKEEEKFKCPNDLPFIKSEYQKNKKKYQADLFKWDRAFLAKLGHDDVCDLHVDRKKKKKKLKFDEFVTEVLDPLKFDEFVTEVLDPLIEKYANGVEPTPVTEDTILRRVKVCSLVTVWRIMRSSQFINNLADNERKGDYEYWLHHLQVTTAFLAYTAALCIFYQKRYKGNALKKVHSVPTEYLADYPSTKTQTRNQDDEVDSPNLTDLFDLPEFSTGSTQDV